MFEVGKRYEIEVAEPGGDRSYIRGKALAVEGTLLKLDTDRGVRIFNTSATSFVAAQEWRDLPVGSKYQSRPEPRG